MDILHSLRSIFEMDDHKKQAGGAGSSFDSFAELFGPALLGGLAGALLGRRGGGGFLRGALLAGGGAYLWDVYKRRIRDANQGTPGYGRSSAPDERARRLVRALVFAAKSDGDLDEHEKAAINLHMRRLGIEREGVDLVRQAINEPLNPALIGSGVMDEEEALQLFTLSCAMVDMDQFMEKNYLDSLASILRIPADVRDEIETRVRHGGAVAAV